MDRVLETSDGRVWCERCLRIVRADYVSQDPAPCGCAWHGDAQTGFLVASESLVETDRAAVVNYIRGRGRDPRETFGDQPWLCAYCGAYIPVWERHDAEKWPACHDCRPCA